MRIALMTSRPLREKRVSSAWSQGINYMMRALQKYCGEVSYLGPVSLSEANSFPVITDRIYNKVSSLFLKKKFNWIYGLPLSKRYGRIFSDRLSGQKYDLIFAPVAKTEIAFLDTKIPIVYLADSTYAQMIEYYPLYCSNTKRSLREGNIVESRAIEKAKMILYLTAWAARSAVKDYHADSGKVHVIPIGANIDEENMPPREVALGRKKSTACKMLFIGVDWVRKGGKIAFETLLKLEALGINAELIVCGCVPPRGVFHKRMRVIPFASEKERNFLYQTSDFFLFPTRAECFGAVLAEASAFGLPAISTDTGGLSEVVKHGETGFLLPLSAKGEDYARVIADIYKNDDLYYRMVRSSRQIFEEKFNWDAWGKSVKELITRIG